LRRYNSVFVVWIILVCENVIFEAIVYKCDLFTKTGSGQT
jgi:hypothetical protein